MWTLSAWVVVAAELSVGLGRYRCERQPWCGHLFSLRCCSKTAIFCLSLPSWVSIAIKHKRKSCWGTGLVARGSHPDHRSFPFSVITECRKWRLILRVIVGLMGGTPPPAHEQGSTTELRVSLWACPRHRRGLAPFVVVGQLRSHKLCFSLVSEIRSSRVCWDGARLTTGDAFFYVETWPGWQSVKVKLSSTDKKKLKLRLSWTNVAVLWSLCPGSSVCINHKQAKQIKWIFIQFIYGSSGLVYEHCP